MPIYHSVCSGSVETTRVILEAGATTNAENSVGRTASQLAAFVGMSSFCYHFTLLPPFLVILWSYSRTPMNMLIVTNTMA